MAGRKGLNFLKYDTNKHFLKLPRKALLRICLSIGLKKKSEKSPSQFSAGNASDLQISLRHSGHTLHTTYRLDFSIRRSTKIYEYKLKMSATSGTDTSGTIS
ncbi:hypothetical protein C1H46_016077 [Malus baccata]|uniref:Uncharacterized protein n=1 Tax=Malus baccata TaxID=106549 RepID=A0A540MHM2_MALBA|nr:hypothetical protein C1H46_016077 [Malus baccata]